MRPKGRYVFIDCTWRWIGRGCRYVEQTTVRLTYHDYIKDVLAVKGH